MQHEIPIPLALRNLIESNNEILRLYQRNLSEQVMMASEDTMKLLGLNPTDGWALDTNKMAFVKEEEHAPSVSE